MLSCDAQHTVIVDVIIDGIVDVIVDIIVHVIVDIIVDVVVDIIVDVVVDVIVDIIVDVTVDVVVIVERRPEFILRPRDQTVSLGGSVSLTCRASPDADVQWLVYHSSASLSMSVCESYAYPPIRLLILLHH